MKKITVFLTVAVLAAGAQAVAADLQDWQSNAPKNVNTLKAPVRVVNLWATWCGPCRKEMPLLEGIYRKYKPMGFTMIGVNVEPDSKAAEEWLAKQGPVSFPIAFDTDSKVSKLYKVNGMPNSVIIDRKGNVRLLHRGYKPGDENTYLDQIRMLVRE